MSTPKRRRYLIGPFTHQVADWFVLGCFVGAGWLWLSLWFAGRL